MSHKPSESYTVPAKLRSLENLHVLFWLVKDICWCLGIKPLGITMIFPTLSVAIYLTWKNRHITSELAHNIAISLWIVANSLWMTFEFTGTDEQLKTYCLIPFCMGLAVLVFYYGYYLPFMRRASHLKTHPSDPA